MRCAARRAGALLLACAGLTLLPGTAGAAVVVPDGGFVIHGSTTDVKRGIDIAHDAGARWISLSTSWEALEPERDLSPGAPGAAAWAALQEQLAYAASRGVRAELRFSNAPAWASGREGVANDPPTPANYAAFGDFLTAVTQRLGPYLDAYSPWNEPNITRFWDPVSPEAYTALQKVAYTAIKAGDPTATVLSAAIIGRYAGANTGYPYLRRAYQAGLAGYVDVIGWNGYPGGEPESDGPVEGGVPSASTLPAQLYLRDLIDQYDPGRKVWIMETGWSTCAPCNQSAANGATEAQQADYLTRAFTYRRRYLTAVTERIFWFELRDAGTDQRNWFQNQGVVRNDFSPKPALAAFTALGVEAPSGTIPGPGSVVAPIGTGAGLVGLPASATRAALPAAGRSRVGAIRLGRGRLVSRRGRFTLTLAIVLRGGPSRVRVEGFRAHHWRLIATARMSRSGSLRVRFPDRAYLGFRVRATVPGLRGWRVGRIVRIRTAGRG